MVGGRLGPYRLDRELGVGGMGRVWLATAEEHAPGIAPGTQVALKIVHPHLLETPGFFHRFLREAQVGRAVVHPNVVRTFDAKDIMMGEVRHHVLVMEYVEGQTLRALLEELGTVPEELCRRVGREVAKGLAAIHAAGAVHRDLKPENVLITRDHHVVKVMDLGVARLADEVVRLSQSGSFVGSVQYAAPEQVRDPESVDGRTDLHALGLVLYEMATGRNPYEADGLPQVLEKVLHEEPRRLGDVDPQLSPFFEEVVHELLAKDRAKRFPSAEELARVLDEGETSRWWTERSKVIRAATKRPLRRIRIPRETAIHGRDAELAKLRALYEKAKAGEGQVVLVEGEAGIGKSRLVDEFVGQLQRDGEDLNFLFGAYPSGGAATASGAFSTAYREHLGSEGLEDALRAALPQIPLLVPAFAALLRGDATPTGAESLTKDSLQTVFVRATQSFAAQRPTIVLVEDLQFAPDEGRALFASLSLAVPGHRILLVGTARPGIDEKWVANLTRLGQTSRLALPRLSPADLVRLLRDALRSDHLAEELGGRIGAKSDGNPYFVFEILRGLREGRFLARKPDGTWVTTKLIRDIAIPSSISDLVNARVADLPQEDRDLLDVASCCGFEFDPAVVADAVGAGLIPTLKRFAVIEKRDRLVRGSGRKLAFDHHQVQETLYSSLYEQMREAYHAAIAVAIEVRSGAAARDPKELDGPLCVDLAEHFLGGAQGTRALRYLDAALTHLEKGYLNDAAARLAGRALAVPGLVEGVARCDLLLRREERRSFAGRSAAAQAAIEEAIALAEAAGDGAARRRALLALGNHHLASGGHAAALVAFENALASALLDGDRAAEASAEGGMGSALGVLGRKAEARPHVERHLALARQSGDPAAEILALNYLAILERSVARHEEARVLCGRALALAREHGYRLAEVTITGNLGNVLWSMGRREEARAHAERQLALAGGIGHRQAEAIALGNLAAMSLALGRAGEALSQLERRLAVSHEIGDRRGEEFAQGNLGRVRLLLGRIDEATAHLTRALALAREVGHPAGEGWWLMALAEAAEERGDMALAERLCREAVGIRRAHGLRSEEAEPLVRLGALLVRGGRADEGAALLEEGLAIAREMGVPETCARALEHLAGARRVAPAAAAEAYAAAAALMLPPTELCDRFLLWKATREPAHLAEAKRLLDFLVDHAPPDCRESMLANVHLHREIAAAAREAGL